MTFFNFFRYVLEKRWKSGDNRDRTSPSEVKAYFAEGAIRNDEVKSRGHVPYERVRCGIFERCRVVFG